jgi:predicted alternative tryptophan synthase beta-subunit
LKRSNLPTIANCSKKYRSFNKAESSKVKVKLKIKEAKLLIRSTTLERVLEVILRIYLKFYSAHLLAKGSPARSSIATKGKVNQRRN